MPHPINAYNNVESEFVVILNDDVIVTDDCCVAFVVLEKIVAAPVDNMLCDDKEDSFVDIVNVCVDIDAGVVVDGRGAVVRLSNITDCVESVISGESILVVKGTTKSPLLST